MAKKKRRQSAPRPVSPVVSADSEGKIPARVLLLLGGLALVFAWLSFLGALSGGQLNWNDILEGDTLRPWLMFRDIGNESAPLSGWHKPGSGMWAPDIAILWTLYAVGMDFRLAALLFPLLQSVLAAVGWILVCDRLCGKSPVRRAAVLILHSLPLLLVAHRGLDLFYNQTVPLWRFGTWAFVPWLMWLSLRALEFGGNEKQNNIRLAILAGAATVAAASDLAIVAWFLAPAIFSAGALAFFGTIKKSDFARFAAALVLSVPVGQWLDGVFGVGEGASTRTDIVLDFSHFAAVGRVALSLLGGLAGRNAPEMALCAAFALAAGVWFWRTLAGGGRRGGRNVAPTFAALLVFSAMFAPLLAALTRQHFGAMLDPGKFHHSSHRYFLPLFYFPLFAGWALLPWNFAAAARHGRRIVAGAAVLVVALAAPGALSIRAAELDAFSSPFHRCFAENARRLNWSGGLAGYYQTAHLAANPDAGVERVLPVSVRREAGGSEVLSHWIFNRHWYSGEYQFVALSGFNGRVFHTLPSAAEPGCPRERANECLYPAHFGAVVDAAAVAAAFGEPQEIVDCEGFGFFHYDPPLRFDLAPLGAPPNRARMENTPLKRENQ